MMTKELQLSEIQINQKLQYILQNLIWITGSFETMKMHVPTRVAGFEDILKYLKLTPFEEDGFAFAMSTLVPKVRNESVASTKFWVPISRLQGPGQYRSAVLTADETWTFISCSSLRECGRWDFGVYLHPFSGAVWSFLIT